MRKECVALRTYARSLRKALKKLRTNQARVIPISFILICLLLISFTLASLTSTEVQYWNFDFGTTSSPVASGYIGLNKSSFYDSSIGYGWTDTSGLSSRDRGAPDDLRRDLVQSVSDHTFNVDLANGDYQVTLTIGDYSYRHDVIDVYAEDNLEVNDLTCATGTFHEMTFAVTVSDGQLNIRFHDDGGTDRNWVINAIMIEPPLSTTDLNNDGIFNMLDITIAAQAYGAKFNETDGMYWHDPPCKYCPHTSDADLDGNKEINIVDLAMVAKDYGKTGANSLWLHTEGKHVKDVNNQIMKIRGVVKRFPRSEGLNIVKQDLDMLYDYGVRFVRFEQGWEKWIDLTDSTYAENRQLFADILDYMKTKGMRAFLSIHGGAYHDMQVLVNPGYYLPVWKNIADTFRNQDALVGLGYWNEASLWWWRNTGGYSKEQFYEMNWNLYYKVASALSAINPNLLICVGGHGAGYLLFNEPLPFNNVVYVYNLHYHYETNRDWYKKYAQGDISGGTQGLISYLYDNGPLMILAQNRPIINMEYSFNVNEDPYWQEVAESGWFGLMDDYGIGGMAFQFVPNPNADNAMALIYNRYTLSKWGQLWQKHLP